MREPNPELAERIKGECLSLLMEKEPGDIGMRDIAGVCGVTATTIYYYYKDKECLFEQIKLDCLREMEVSVLKRLSPELGALESIREGLRAFRDWAFKNPRMTLLVLGRFKPNLTAQGGEMRQYYRLNDLIAGLLKQARDEGRIECPDPTLWSGLIVAGFCGAVESLIQKRTDPEYWNQEILFTDGMIDMLCPVSTGKGAEK